MTAGGPGDAPPAVPGRGAGLLLVVLLALVVHARALGGGFVYDDGRFVVKNARIEEIGDPVQFFTDPGTADPSRTPDIYRPLRTLAFAVERAAFGLDPGPWHGASILVHVVNAALLYLLLIQFGIGAAGAAAGAAVFAVHPAQVEAVAWVSSLGDLLAALFTLLSIRSWLRSRGPDRWYAAALGAGLLACLSKEAALVFPGFLVLADLARPDGGGPARVRAHRWAYALPALIAGCFGLGVRGMLMGARGGQLGHLGRWWGGSYGTNLATAAKAAAYQGLFAAVPLRPSTEWLVAPPTSALDPLSLLCGAAVLGALFLAARAALRGGREARTAGAGVLLFALGGLMTSSLLFTVGIPRSDRFLYLSLAGAAMVHGVAFERLARLRPLLGPALAAAGVLGMAILTVARIPAFRDDDSFWREVSAGLPGPRLENRALTMRNREGLALLGRAGEEEARGEAGKARATRVAAAAIFDEVAAGAAVHNARFRGHAGMDMDPGLEPAALRNAALARLRAGDPAGALEALAKAARIEPSSPRGLQIEARALLAQGRVQRAGWRIESSLAQEDPGRAVGEAASTLNEVAGWRAAHGLDGAALRALRLSASLVPDARRNPAVAALPGLEEHAKEQRRALAAAADARPRDFAVRAAQILYEGRGGSPGAARKAFAEFFGAVAGEPQVRDVWGAATMEADDTEEGWRAAEAWHRLTIDQFPSDAGALLGVARCRESLEDPSEAARYCRHVLELPGLPDDARREASETLRRLSK